MATTTPNFGWDVPQSTDLVKDGATAIAALGNDIDTSLVDLKGGTTGQVLSKASNTDMDFTWVAQDDSNAIQNALLTTTGDTIYASGASTPARLGIGSSGQVLTVSGGLPTWATPSSGSMTLLSTTSLTGASVVISSISSSYNHLQLIIRNFRPATDGATLRMRINGDTASRYSSNYGATTSTLGGSSINFADSELFITDGIDNTATESIAVINFYDYANSGTWKMGYSYWGCPNQTTSANRNYGQGFHWYNQTGAISSLTFYPSTGNWNAGTVLLYGVK